MSDNLETLANSLMTSLTADVDIELPDIDLSQSDFNFPSNTQIYQEIKPLTNEDYTQRVANGDGAFDAIMAGVAAHLAVEYDKSRITGDEYAKAYIALTEAALANATQFLMNRDATYWASQTAQLQAITARLQLEIEKTRLVTAHIDALNAKSNYALTKGKLAEMAIEASIKQYTLENILPQEHLKLAKEMESMDIQNRINLFNLNTMMPTQHQSLELEMESKRFNLDQVLPAELEMLNAQTQGERINNDTKIFNLDEILPTQKAGLEAETSIKAYQVSDILPTQKAGMLADNSIKTYQLTEMMPLEKASLTTDNSIKSYRLTNLLPLEYETGLYNITEIMPLQRSSLEGDVAIKEYQYEQLMPIDKNTKQFNLTSILPVQEALLKEQVEVQNAQTRDTRVGGGAVTGTLGKQKELYAQQIESYKRNAEFNAAKLFSDAWITQKTLDEGLVAPTAFTNTSVNTVMTALLNKLGM